MKHYVREKKKKIAKKQKKKNKTKKNKIKNQQKKSSFFAFLLYYLYSLVSSPKNSFSGIRDLCHLILAMNIFLIVSLLKD